MASADKHLTGYATWTVPKAGMFVWVKVGTPSSLSHAVLFLSTPHRGQHSIVCWHHGVLQVLHLRGKGRAESEALFHELVKEDVLVVPGYAFDATGGAADPVRTFKHSHAL